MNYPHRHNYLTVLTNAVRFVHNFRLDSPNNRDGQLLGLWYNMYILLLIGLWFMSSNRSYIRQDFNIIKNLRRHFQSSDRATQLAKFFKKSFKRVEFVFQNIEPIHKNTIIFFTRSIFPKLMAPTY